MLNSLDAVFSVSNPPNKNVFMSTISLGKSLWFDINKTLLPEVNFLPWHKATELLSQCSHNSYTGSGYSYLDLAK